MGKVVSKIANWTYNKIIKPVAKFTYSCVIKPVVSSAVRKLKALYGAAKFVGKSCYAAGQYLNGNRDGARQTWDDAKKDINRVVNDIPIIGDGINIYRGIRDGNWRQVVASSISIGMDIFTGGWNLTQNYLKNNFIDPIKNIVRNPGHFLQESWNNVQQGWINYVKNPIQHSYHLLRGNEVLEEHGHVGTWTRYYVGHNGHLDDTDFYCQCCYNTNGGKNKCDKYCNSQWQDYTSTCHCEKRKVGYWKHPSGNQLIWSEERPSDTYRVEINGNYLRCVHCKNASHVKDWNFKCHDMYDHQLHIVSSNSNCIKKSYYYKCCNENIESLKGKNGCRNAQYYYKWTCCDGRYYDSPCCHPNVLSENITSLFKKNDSNGIGKWYHYVKVKQYGSLGQQIANEFGCSIGENRPYMDITCDEYYLHSTQIISMAVWRCELSLSPNATTGVMYTIAQSIVCHDTSKIYPYGQIAQHTWIIGELSDGKYVYSSFFRNGIETRIVEDLHKAKEGGSGNCCGIERLTISNNPRKTLQSLLTRIEHEGSTVRWRLYANNCQHYANMILEWYEN